MIKDIMDDIISERKSKNIEDDYGIQNCWNKMIDILSKDINETVAYLENCSEEDIYFIVKFLKMCLNSCKVKNILNV